MNEVNKNPRKSDFKKGPPSSRIKRSLLGRKIDTNGVEKRKDPKLIN